MRDPQLIALPYHNGLPDVGMGAGVRVLLTELGRPPTWCRRWTPAGPRCGARWSSTGGWPSACAPPSRRARSRSCWPATATAAWAPWAGSGPDGLGVVWFDAHADFDTPEDNVSGFFDVMALAT